MTVMTTTSNTISCSSGFIVSQSPPQETPLMATASPNTALRVPSSSSSFLVRAAMRVSRARWFKFLRRVFHYQNGSSSSDLGSNPYNSGTWMVMELIALLVQITVITYTISVSETERPIWPMRMWVAGYGVGCVLSLLLLGWRYRVFHTGHGDGSRHPDLEQQRMINTEDSSSHQMMTKFKTCLDLFFAMWFVMGNVWVFDSRLGSSRRAPKLHVLCISLLSWNALAYSFPFLLFILLCCCVPLVSSCLGYNMNMASIDRGASEDEISELPSWKFKGIDIIDMGKQKSAKQSENQECCICLSKYREKEELRQLPCSHVFHLNCVDQWLRIISCCPLCKQQLQR